MRWQLTACLAACVCYVMGGCLSPPGEDGQWEWHDELTRVSSAVVASLATPATLFSAGQLDILIWRDPDDGVTVAELIARLPDEATRQQVLSDLAGQLDLPGVREALGLADATTAPVDEQLAGRFWVYQEDIHFARPMPDADGDYRAYCFYVIDEKVGAALVISDWPATE